MFTYCDELSKESPQFQKDVQQLKNKMMSDYSRLQTRETHPSSQIEITQRSPIFQSAMSKTKNDSDPKLSLRQET